MMVLSCSITIVVAKQAAKPFAAFDLALHEADFLPWIDQLIVQLLVISLSMIMY
jgi:hypothetical protein